MGFKNPIVCKEVYLPCDIDEEGLSFKQYKNKFGIDIEKIFDINFDEHSVATITNNFTKIYLVGNYYAFNVGMLTRIIDVSDEANPHKFRIMTGDDDYGFGIDIHIDTKTIKHFEI